MVAEDRSIEDTFEKLIAHHHGIRAASHIACMRSEQRGLEQTSQTSQIGWWRDTDWHPQEMVAMNDGRRAATQPGQCEQEIGGSLAD